MMIERHPGMFAPLHLLPGNSPLFVELPALSVQFVKIRSEFDLDVSDNSYSMDTTATPWRPRPTPGVRGVTPTTTRSKVDFHTMRGVTPLPRGKRGI